MNKELHKFLENSEGDRVWFATPSGVIRGELQTLESKDPETVMLKKTQVYVGNKPIEVAEARLLISHIIAWGDHFEDE
jgi:hypothetical protein